MASTAAAAAAAARNLLKSSKSLPQILRTQILGRSNVNVGLNLGNNMAKNHQIVQPFAQRPISDFRERGSLLGSSRRLSLVEGVDGRRVRGGAAEAGGKQVDDEFDDDDMIVDDDDDDDEYHDERYELDPSAYSSDSSDSSDSEWS